MYDVWDLVFAAAIAVPVVVGGLGTLFYAMGRSEQKLIASLIARLTCPRCGASPLVWTGVCWLVEVYVEYDESSDDESEEGDDGGYEFRCEACTENWWFTIDGALYSPRDPDSQCSDG
jgi:hypothetical protein